MNTDNNRKKKYEKDESLEFVLEKVNERLSLLEKELLEQYEAPKLPIIFIVGAQRSGTTLLMQLLIQRYYLEYPTNFIARFWSCPFVGAKLYKSFDLTPSKNLESDLGYTKDLSGPHEFGYFWKRWFPWLAFEKESYEEIDYSKLKKELAAWESINENPLVFKNIIHIPFHIKKIYKLFPKAFFLHIEREELYNVQSTYKSRLKLYGSENEWLGGKPRAYQELLGLPVFDQITGQVRHINQDINNQLQQIPRENYLQIKYSEMIADPATLFKSLENKISKIFNLKIRNITTAELTNQNVKRVDESLFVEMERAVENYKK
jgi:hypothetical protein